MSERIITLFGEEIVPEQPKQVNRSRAKKKSEDKNEDTDSAENAEQDIVAGNEEQFVPVESTIIELETTPDEVPPVSSADSEITNELQSVEEKAPVSTEVVATAEVTVKENNEETTTDTSTEIIDETDSIADNEAKKLADKKINLPEDWKGEKLYYTIGEVAELFKVKTSHIRFWTNEFKLKVRTTRKGDRLYTPEQIKEIRAIHHLVKERGFTLNGAKAKLAAPANLEVETVDLKKSLSDLRAKLIAIRNQLK